MILWQNGDKPGGKCWLLDRCDNCRKTIGKCNYDSSRWKQFLMRMRIMKKFDDMEEKAGDMTLL